MADPFLAEIRMFGCNFAPQGWTTCDGQLLPISQNTAVFSLVGTFYGGNGTSNFALPNLQGSAAMHQGNGPGLTQRQIGETGGEQIVTLINTEMPQHSHVPMGKAGGTLADPNGLTWANPGGKPAPNFFATGPLDVSMNPAALSNSGGSQPHNNLMPFLVLTFCIALQGIYPARS